MKSYCIHKDMLIKYLNRNKKIILLIFIKNLKWFAKFYIV